MKRSAKTSKRTLAKLRADRENGLPDLTKLESLLSDYHPPYSSILEQRLKKLGDTLLPNFRTYLTCVPIFSFVSFWLTDISGPVVFLLFREGFNILLYGVGSKLRLLSRLQNEYLNGNNCLVVSGYSPTVSIRKVCVGLLVALFSQVLNVIVDEVMQVKEAPAAVEERLDLVIDHFSRPGQFQYPLLVCLCR